ncbi:cytochrome c oxidase assembly protein [Bacillus salitolerans]|uniref:Cytochrome c oxidase assembly protein n=1 Tax=Bacillus salitolerans TaxID=1437434 RepID=A0ABW4LUK7_9BACI
MNVLNHIHHGENVHYGNPILSQSLLATLFMLGIILYGFAVFRLYRKHKRWPLYKLILWGLGSCLVLFTVMGPFATQAHYDFKVHMIGHLFLGMFAPLLMAMSSPMTLLFKSVHVSVARKIAFLLKCWQVRLITHPIVATLLNIGGLWVLYTTDLYLLMHNNSVLYFFIHLHVFIAGYVFTISMVYMDPVIHRFSVLYRSIVFILALAAHGILSKYLYSNPPYGVPLKDAEQGAMIMYYGGDLIDGILLVLIFMQWYRRNGQPKPEMVMVFDSK